MRGMFFGQLLSKMNLLGPGVEVGVQGGVFSLELLQFWPGQLFLIDRWAYQSDGYEGDPANATNAEHQLKMVQTVTRMTHCWDRVRILQLFSNEAAQIFLNDSLDFVYIDGNHHYEAVLQDLKLWYPKVKQGGVIAGHDYGDYPHMRVKPAVDEFFANKETVQVVDTPNEGINWVVTKQAY